MSVNGPPAPPPRDERARRSGRSAAIVAAGILISRVSGVVREVAIAAKLGTTAVADSFGAALRIPKLLQNLLGEGSLSASFIPVYARLVEDGDDEGAGRTAGAVASLLTLMTGLLVAVGIFAARPLTRAVAPGFGGEKLDVTVTLLRIMVAGIGFLVLSAWCLGVLNSHRRFFLSYVAPVVWNAAIVIALVVAAVSDWTDVEAAEAAAWGVLIGGVLQFLVQLPSVIRVAPHLRLGLGLGDASVRTVARRFAPAVAGRGVVTVSSYLDVLLASLLATGAVAALDRSQVLYLLPISAFALSVAAAELPELSRGGGSHDELIERLDVGLQRIALFVLFSAAAFIVTGPVIVEALYERGSFGPDDTDLVWLVLAAYSLGLPAAGMSRLLQNARYAAGDVAGPARIAAGRMVVSAALGVVLMFQLDRVGIVSGDLEKLGDLPASSPLDEALRDEGGLKRLGAVGLALGAAAAAWVELVLLQRLVRRDVPRSPRPGPTVARLLPAAAVGAAVGWAAMSVLRSVPALVAAPIVLGVSAVVYLLIARRVGNHAARQLTAIVRGRR